MVVVEAEKKSLFFPPDYDITINSSESTLKMAKWVCRNFSSLYKLVKQFVGEAYFLLESESAKIQIMSLPQKSGGLSQQLRKSLSFQKGRTCMS